MIHHTRDIDLQFYLGLIAWGAFFEVDMYERGSSYERKKLNNFDSQWNFMPERSGTTPGQEITPGIRIWAWEPLKIIKNHEKLINFENDEIYHEMHFPVDFSPSNIQISHADARVRRCAETPELFLSDS